jgi:2-haloacid dehalogenase
VKNVKALIFDVFGTVVDWRTSVIDECLELAKANNINADWGRFADRWRAKYGPFMNKVRNKEIPWTNLDALHRMALDELLSEFHIDTLSEDDKYQLNLCWHRLQPWPDSVSGLTSLKKHFVIAPLSNGNLALLTNMAKNADLPWDCILSAELAKAYKPDPCVYKMAVELLGLQPNEVVMVAAHQGDLRAAKKIGLKTAFIPRPLEHGSQSNPDLKPDPDFDVFASNLDELAKEMARHINTDTG